MRSINCLIECISRTGSGNTASCPGFMSCGDVLTEKTTKAVNPEYEEFRHGVPVITNVLEGLKITSEEV